MPSGILLDENMGLQVQNGTLVIGDITRQNQKLLIFSDKGEIKEAIKRGVGARRYLEAGSPEALAREVRTEFIADGMKVNTIKDNQGILQTNAYYPEK